jgi:hypothetical protein
VSLGRLMDANFDLRRRIYGDAVIGARNLEMIGLPGPLDCLRSSRGPAALSSGSVRTRSSSHGSSRRSSSGGSLWCALSRPRGAWTHV